MFVGERDSLVRCVEDLLDVAVSSQGVEWQIGKVMELSNKH